MKVKEIRELSQSELAKRLDETYKELFNLRFQLSTGQLANFHELHKVEKDIARIKTIIREQELAKS